MCVFTSYQEQTSDHKNTQTQTLNVIFCQNPVGSRPYSLHAGDVCLVCRGPFTPCNVIPPFLRKERRSDSAGLPVNVCSNSVSPENPSIRRYLDSEEQRFLSPVFRNASGRDKAETE